MDQIAIGIIGAGAIACEKHIPNLKRISGVEIKAVCNRSFESSKRVAEPFQIPGIFEDWRELVSNDELDAVLIAAWPYLHCECTLAALEADKHVLCEARMAMNAAEAEKMLNAALSKPKLVTQLVPAPMTLHVDRSIIKLINEERFGQVLAIRILDGNTFLDPTAEMHWRQNIAFSGCNILSLGIWYEAVMRWIGPATSVQAAGKIFTDRRNDRDGNSLTVEIPEHLDIVADMECGAQLSMNLSQVTGLAGPGKVSIFGSNGTIVFENDKLLIGYKGTEQLIPYQQPTEENQPWRVEEEFINAIRGKEQIRLTTFTDGLRYMKFTEAVAQSLKAGELVFVK